MICKCYRAEIEKKIILNLYKFWYFHKEKKKRLLWAWANLTRFLTMIRELFLGLIIHHNSGDNICSTYLRRSSRKLGHPSHKFSRIEDILCFMISLYHFIDMPCKAYFSASKIQLNIPVTNSTGLNGIHLDWSNLKIIMNLHLK